MTRLLAIFGVGACLAGCAIIPLDGVGGTTVVLVERERVCDPAEHAPYGARVTPGETTQLVVTR